MKINFENKKIYFKSNCFFFIARSQAFARILKANQKEATIDVSTDIFEAIVKFMYSGEVEITERTERHLLAAAERFELKEIISAIQLQRNIRMEPIKAKELEELKQKYDEAKYLYTKAKDRYSIRNPFSQVANCYY